MYHTLFKSNGEIVKLIYKPNLKRMHKMLDCEYIDVNTFGFFYNGKDHDEAEIIVDDLFVSKEKPINRIVSDALSKSIGWRNRAYIIANKTKFVVCGNVLVITAEELLTEGHDVPSIQGQGGPAMVKFKDIYGGQGGPDDPLPDYNFIDDHTYDEEDLDSWIKYEKEQKELNALKALNALTIANDPPIPPINQQKAFKAFPEID